MNALVEPWFRLGYVTPTAQALILPGGRWFSIHAVARLEAEFGKPVLLNLNASLWAALHSAEHGLPLADRGTLLGSSR